MPEKFNPKVRPRPNYTFNCMISCGAKGDGVVITNPYSDEETVVSKSGNAGIDISTEEISLPGSGVKSDLDWQPVPAHYKIEIQKNQEAQQVQQAQLIYDLGEKLDAVFVLEIIALQQLLKNVKVGTNSPYLYSGLKVTNNNSNFITLNISPVVKDDQTTIELKFAAEGANDKGVEVKTFDGFLTVTSDGDSDVTPCYLEHFCFGLLDMLSPVLHSTAPVHILELKSKQTKYIIVATHVLVESI